MQTLQKNILHTLYNEHFKRLINSFKNSLKGFREQASINQMYSRIRLIQVLKFRAYPGYRLLYNC